MAATPTWEQVCARRLQRHGLITPYPDIVTAVRAMAGAHAQVMSAAEISIGLRTGATKSDVESAVWDAQDLIKMYGLRGTVHLVPAADYGSWTAALDVLTSPPQIKDILTAKQTDEVLQAIADAVADGPKTTAELDEAVIGSTGPWAADPVMPNFGGSAPRWRHALGTASRRGLICFGPNRGRNTTFKTAPKTPSRTGDAANWLLTSFLHAYGPATPEQFARWTAGPKPAARATFAEADLRETEFGFINNGDDDWPDPTENQVLLLPYFDAYTVGCHPRSLLFPGLARPRAAPNGSAGNFPVVLLDGSVVGVWHLRKSGRKIHLTVEALRQLDADQDKQIHQQADRIAVIVDAEPTVTFGDVTVASHR
jgi:winged helix DNA-binding protein